MKRAGWVLGMLFLLIVCSPVSAEVSGYFEATADNNWQGAFVLHTPDGGVVAGVAQVALEYGGGFPLLPLVTTGCVVSTSCSEWNDTTMTFLSINLRGSAVLGTVGAVEWRTQGPRLIAGDPSPPVAVLGDVIGTISGYPFTGSYQDFLFNTTMSTTFVSVLGGQALHSIRFDFSDTVPPPWQKAYWDGHVWVDIGFPVPLGSDPYVAPAPIVVPTVPTVPTVPGKSWKAHLKKMD